MERRALTFLTNMFGLNFTSTRWSCAAHTSAARSSAIQRDSRIYTQFGANYNVTALIGYNASTQALGVAWRFCAMDPRGKLIPIPGFNPQSMGTIVPPGIQGTRK